MSTKLLTLGLGLVLLISACADEDLAPVVTQDTLLFGAFPRLIELRAGEFDLANLSTSAYDMEVDFVDNAEGRDVAEYRIYMQFQDNNPENGDASTDRTLFRTLTPGDFRPGPNGNLGVDVTIPFTEAAQFVGVSLDDVMSGDRFRITSEVEKEDGRIFSNDNSTSAIANTFGGIFNFNITATCPLGNDEFVGDYVITYGEVYEAFELFGATVTPFGQEPFSRTVTLTLVPGSTTRRNIAIGTYLVPGYNFDAGTITLDFACDVVTSTNVDSGAGCGSGTLAAGQNGTASFDLNDDSTWTIPFNDFASDGGCGVSPMPFTLVFTKQ